MVVVFSRRGTTVVNYRDQTLQHDYENKSGTWHDLYKRVQRQLVSSEQRRTPAMASL